MITCNICTDMIGRKTKFVMLLGLLNFFEYSMVVLDMMFKMVEVFEFHTWATEILKKQQPSQL